jgi:hypothetical protein
MKVAPTPPKKYGISISSFSCLMVFNTEIMAPVAVKLIS